MKKIYAIIALILITAMSLSAAACATTHAQEEPAKEQQTAPTSVPFTPTETGEPFGGELGGDNFLPDPGLLHKLGGDFYRIEYTGTNREPVIVSSTKQLRELNIPGFDSATRSSMESKYSDATFASARAAVFGVTFSSGSAVPTVTSIKVEDGVIRITVEGVMEGEFGTCDMASYIGVVLLDNQLYPDDLPIEIVGGNLPETGSGEDR